VSRLWKWISTGSSKATVCAVVLFPLASGADGAENDSENTYRPAYIVCLYASADFRAPANTMSSTSSKRLETVAPARALCVLNSDLTVAAAAQPAAEHPLLYSTVVGSCREPIGWPRRSLASVAAALAPRLHTVSTRSCSPTTSSPDEQD
jgi:hypothetical protein